MRPWSRSNPTIAPDLQAELQREPRWMYEWQLAPGIVPPILGPELASVHETRAAMMESAIRGALGARPEATAIDLACNEGWFAHRLLDWGAAHVRGIDIREQNIARARLIRDHFEISSKRLTFERGDIFDLPSTGTGSYDVVLLLGLIYHVEDPVGALRRARGLTRSIAVVESQLTRQSDPIIYGWGQSHAYEQASASFAARYEADQDGNPLASAGGVLSLIPNRPAMEQMALAAGFSQVEFLDADAGLNPQYVEGDRAIVICRI